MSPQRNSVDRLRRMLAMVPYIADHPEVTLQELSKRFNMELQELEEDLGLLSFCGLPPYSPDRLIDVEIIDDRVTIRFAEYFSRPLRLNAQEGFAVFAAGQTLLAVEGAEKSGPLATALKKLSDVLGVTDALVVNIETPQFLEVLRSAAQNRETVTIDYFSVRQAERSTRDIDPWSIKHAYGNWYVSGFCHLTKAERVFRVDGIQDVTPTGRHFETPDSDSEMGFHPQTEDPRITLQLQPAARWVIEAYPTENVETHKDGSLTVLLAVGEQAWLERLLLKLGANGRVLEPPEYRDLAQQAAQRILAMYNT